MSLLVFYTLLLRKIRFKYSKCTIASTCIVIRQTENYLKL